LTKQLDPVQNFFTWSKYSSENLYCRPFR